MRHVYFRSVLGIIWLAAAIVSLNPFFGLLGGVFCYSAFSMWKKEKNAKGEN